MRSLAALAACLAIYAHAAPTWPSFSGKDAANPLNALDDLSLYFNLIASKVEAAKALQSPPTCDLSKARMPMVDGLPPVSQGLTLRHVAVGSGVQNYTCDTSKPDNAPTANGAMATLFNVTCMATVYGDVAEKMPGMAVHFKLTDTDKLGPSVLPVSGHHFFTSMGVPYFNLTTATAELGQAPCAKNSSVAAPSTSSVGQQGEAAVPWLKLTTVDGATADIKEVYRVATAGGSPPATCRGQPAHIEVRYAAQYWFWQA